MYKSEKHYPITHHWLTISCGWSQAAYFKKAKASSSEPEEKPISIKKTLEFRWWIKLKPVFGFNPSENDGVRQLGWWNSQYMEKMFQTTNQKLFLL